MTIRWREALTQLLDEPLAVLRPPFAELRFWLIQLLVASIATLHFVVEWAESHDWLSGFLDGIQDLPVPANIVPVLLAGIWYGMRGGLLTGGMIFLLGVPNLMLFHTSGFGWLGEAVTNLMVVTVGIGVASVVERNFELRRDAEANESRLHLLWELTSALAACDDEDELAAAAVHELSKARRVRGVAFASADAPESSVSAGDPASEDRLRRGLAGPGARQTEEVDGGRVTVLDVSTATRKFGRLAVDCANGRSGAADERLFTLAANELAASLEVLEHREARSEHLRGYARAVTAAQERERLRISRDLHDGPVQSMIVIARALSRLDDPRHPDAAQELRELVHETLGSIQQTSQALRPLLLDDLGLVPAIRSLAERRSRRSGIAIRVDVVGEPSRLGPAVEVVAYRIAQEALTNVERHADTDHASVVVDFSGDTFSMEIRDEGCGMEPGDELRGEQFGIVGMRERAELVGGDLLIDSSPGSGTTVRLTVD